ncbi:DNA-binding protein, partial [Actinocorallia aurantiaca]
GENAKAVELAYVEKMIVLPATGRAAAGWWKAHHQTLVALAGRRPELRGRLLNLMPEPEDRDFPARWLELLEESGATVALWDPDGVPEEARPEDGSAGWLRRFLRVWIQGGDWAFAPGLHSVVERMADRLRAELAASGAELEVRHHPGLLDQLLALDVPVADPPAGHWLGLRRWAEDESRRDLVALSADRRFHGAFHAGADRLRGNEAALLALAASPGGRVMLAEWVGETVRRSTAAGLPGLPRALDQLVRLPGEVLALAEDAVREAVSADLPPILTRTLRAGIFDELGWPAWEEALTALAAPEKAAEVVVADAWPELIVSGPAQARVIGAEGTVLTHDLRVPADADAEGVPCFSYVDGGLLACWPRRSGDSFSGYWHTDAGRSLNIENHGRYGRRMYWYKGDEPVSLPVPGGGRATGTGVLHRGDTVLPEIEKVITDGTSYWVWRGGGAGEEGWYEYDPASGERGRKSMPGFFADATSGLPDGGSFLFGWLLPVPVPEATPVGAPVDGVLGWRIVRLPDGSYRGEDLAGNAVTTDRKSVPFSALFLPGNERPLAVVRGYHEIELVDPDGVVTSHVLTNGAPGPFAEGSALLPPVRYWHCLRPRDPRGSAALRRIDRDTAAALLKAIAEKKDPHQAVRELLPDVTHKALVAGVAGVVRYAAAQQALLERAAERMERVLTEEAVREAPAGPPDRILHEAINGLGYARLTNRGDEAGLFGRLRAIAHAMKAEALRPFPDGRPRIHLDGFALPESRLRPDFLLGGRAAVAYRAVSCLTGAEQWEALRALMETFGELGLAPAGKQPSRWRWFRLRLARTVLTKPDGTLRSGHWQAALPLGGGALLAVLDYSLPADGGEFTAWFHDPAGRFEVPAPYTVISSAPVVDPEEAVRLEDLLAETAARGPAPWFPEAAAEFSRLTGTTEITARLVVAGMPGLDGLERSSLPPEVRAVLKVKAADAAMAGDGLRRLSAEVRLAVVGALVPAEPSRLWTEGPDVAAAARVWNARVGRRVAVPEALMAETAKMVSTGWEAVDALPALLDPESAPLLSRDLKWTMRQNRVTPDEEVAGFSDSVLVGAVATAAWLAHRLPAGDAMRARLPAALTAVRERLANSDLLLSLGWYVDRHRFREMAGAPTETGEGFERYGAVVLGTIGDIAYPAFRPALLDETGEDPYLAVLRGDASTRGSAELAVSVARDERFAALLADPGDPAAGERAADGTWWPQDPSRSVPDLVAEAASLLGLGTDAAVLYLMLLAMPDPTDKNTARWTGWKPARLKAARAEAAATGLVIEARRTRAGRSLFLPGGWLPLHPPRPPLEEWKIPLYDLTEDGGASWPLSVAVPIEPAADLYRRAWRRVREGDVPRFADLDVSRTRRR